MRRHEHTRVKRTAPARAQTNGASVNRAPRRVGIERRVLCTTTTFDELHATTTSRLRLAEPAHAGQKSQPTRARTRPRIATGAAGKPPGSQSAQTNLRVSKPERSDGRAIERNIRANNRHGQSNATTKHRPPTRRTTRTRRGRTCARQGGSMAACNAWARCLGVRDVSGGAGRPPAALIGAGLGARGRAEQALLLEFGGAGSQGRAKERPAWGFFFGDSDIAR